MLIECIGSPIQVDKNDILKDFRLNIAPNRQLRAKMKYLFEEGEFPVDIVVFNYTPKLEMFTLSIAIDGKEMIQNVSFKVWLSFSLLDKTWNLRGTVGKTSVKKEMSSFLELFQVIKDLVSPYRPQNQN